MTVSKDIKYIGVYDPNCLLFEGQFHTPNGMLYNSYLIDDTDIAVTDGVDVSVRDKWLQNITAVLNGRQPKYLIVHHMEPDHSGSIKAFADMYPDATIVASAKAFDMMTAFCGTNYADRRIVAAEGTELSLGKHTLKFFTAPMVHWPEVLISYEEYEKVLFSADGFGRFGGIDGDWESEAARYYFGIVGKYGAQVQALLKKVSGLEITAICPLHGPILKENNISYAVSKYSTWSAYSPDKNATAIAFASVYDNTAEAARKLADSLEKRGIKSVLLDLNRGDIHEAVSEAFRCGSLICCSMTYNGDAFPTIRTFIDALVERGYRGHKIGFIENGSWAPVAAKAMRSRLESAKDITFLEHSVKIKSSVNKTNLDEIDSLAEEIAG